MNIDIISVIANDNRMIAYRPEWKDHAGSITATILLSQIIYRYDKHGRKPFYKFSAPCGNRYYKQGDSWQEEIGFTRYEFEGALKKIAQKISRKNPVEHRKPVEYWTDIDRRTYYTINERNLSAFLDRVYNKNKPVQEQADISELVELLPVPVTPQIENIIRDNLKKHDLEYVKSSIHYTNKNIRDKTKYRIYLEKCLICGWGKDYKPEPAILTQAKEITINELQKAFDILTSSGEQAFIQYCDTLNFNDSDINSVRDRFKRINNELN